jgi:hypothetical protein
VGAVATTVAVSGGGGTVAYRLWYSALRRSIYSVRADLLIDDGTGARISLSSVVDSGAAWTALKHGFLARTAPELLKLMSPSKRRFKDAQGNPMAISGRIPLTVWMGDLKLTTYAYVFPQLSVDCLLGVNTLSKNGMIID